MHLGARLHVLGAGSILPRAGYGCAGYALEPRPGAPLTLFDCGPGSVRALGGAGFGVQDVERVVFSHYHPDHCLDLLALLFARKNPDLAERPVLELIGPAGLRRLIEGGRALFGRYLDESDLVVRELGREESVDPDGRASLEAGGLALACVPTGHNAEAVAWRAELPEGTLAYTGDSPFEPRVAELARGVDLFVVECSFADDEAAPNHLTPTSAGELAALAGCRRLLLTHFYPALDPQTAVAVASRVFPGPVEAAHDGSVHAVASPG